MFAKTPFKPVKAHYGEQTHSSVAVKRTADILIEVVVLAIPITTAILMNARFVIIGKK